ncbi:MipA/OmpV family protein [Parvularcula sp. LCG005]|uniref:MipA/OmpV family protein n=1 Tax=Parvularcula sp. LCG005 TaxID=3078805 RepID=UPI002943B08C|nr:MipA/OmpV family protein [Parvularcula sp. LCG005]WOI52327.1 MipA/OmpV family protein [Parvularcula sp. LCG005]
MIELLAATMLAGQDTEKDFVRPDTVNAVGLGVIVNAEPYRDLDEDVSVNAIPVIVFTHDRFSLIGKAAFFNVLKTDQLSVSLLADYRFEGYEADESPVLAGMDDRDGTLEAGVSVGYEIGAARLSAQTRFDVLGTHEGYDAKLTASYKFVPNRGAEIRPYASVIYRSADLANYYYGVRSDEAATLSDYAGSGEDFLRAAYAPGETISPAIGVQFRQAVSPRWALAGLVQHQFLADEIKDSPLVDADGRTTFGISLVRLFY